MTRTLALLATCLCSAFGAASAATVPLAPYDGRDFSVSMPQSWNIVADADRGIVIARQDPGRQESAAVLLVFRPQGETATEDQLLDTIAGQVAQGLAVDRREAIPGGGHVMIAHGQVGDVKVRLGVVAVATGGASIVSLLVARADEFDRLGGVELVTAILVSIKPHAAPPPAAPPPTAPPPAAPQQGPLVIPPPARPLRVSDLAGEWKNGDPASIQSYYNSSTGSYAGYSSISIRETWNITAKGAISTTFVGVTTGMIGLRSVNEKGKGTVSINPEGTILELNGDKSFHKMYLIRGWLDGPNGTILKISGPFYKEIPADMLADPHKGWNLDSLWVRKAK
jgi:hypothetical protein